MFKDKMFVIVFEGFNLEFLVVMLYDKKDEGKLKFVVYYKRLMDEFKIDWNCYGFWGYWFGENYVDKKEEKLLVLYEVDWKIYDVKFVKVFNDNEKK